MPSRVLGTPGLELNFFIINVGGNSLDTASSSSIRDFVKGNGGHTVITKVCILIHLAAPVINRPRRSSSRTTVRLEKRVKIIN